jgi:ankyrin repeat protein
MAELLLSQGIKDAQINALPARNYGRTALQAAAEQGHIEMAKLLLSQGSKDAQINAPPAYEGGRTALQAAAEQGHIEMAELLLSQDSKDTQINAPPAHEEGRTALQAAAEQGHIEMVELLCANKVDIDAAPGVISGITALGAAVKSGHIKIINFLLQKGATVNMDANRYGETALHIAARQGNHVIVELLVNANANIYARNGTGLTALDIARDRRHSEVVEYLEKRMANHEMMPDSG